MRLDYNILCIDDDIDTLKEPKRRLAAYNETVGINTIYKDISVRQRTREVDIEVFRSRIEKEISEAFTETSFDLIMVDLHLGVFQGHEIINFIREKQTMYRPIVFYSGGDPEGDNNALRQLQEALQNNGLVGKCIFVSSRGTALDRDLSGICREMHAEEHKLNATRGLLMDRTSEVDAQILRHLQAESTWQRLNEEQQEAFFKEIAKDLRKKAERVSGQAENILKLSNGDFNSLQDWFTKSEKTTVWQGMDSFSRNNIFREILRVQPELKESGEIHSRYFKKSGNISSLRNDYAHQTSEEIGTAHSDERCKFIRTELRAHIDNIENIVNSQ